MSVFDWIQQQPLNKRGTILSIICLLYTFIFSTPPITSIIYPEKNVYWDHISRQMDNPFKPIEGYNPMDHEAKLSQRLIVPIIGFLLPTNDNRIRFGFIIVLKAFLGFLFFRMLYLNLSKRDMAKWFPELMTGGLVTLYLGKSFISEYMWFDEFAFFLITLVLFSNHPLIIISAIIGACFTDERAYFSFLFVFGYKIFIYFSERSQKVDANSILNCIKNDGVVFLNQVGILPLTMIFCVFLRMLLIKKFGLVTSITDGGIVFFDYIKNGNIDYLQLGLFAPFKVYWIFIFWALYFFWHKDKFIFMFMLFSLLVITIASVSVWDLSRSLTFAFPLLIISFLLLQEQIPSLDNLKKSFYHPAIAVTLSINFIITPISVSDNVFTDHNIVIKIYERLYK